MRLIAVIILLLVSSSVQAQSGANRDPLVLSVLWFSENEKCEVAFGIDDPRRDAACAARATYVIKLRAISWCYGTDEAGTGKDWHPCQR
jgi:hypothetical protein